MLGLINRRIMNPYKITIYDCMPSNNYRFYLGIKGENPLIIIGLNPSIANKETSDFTISKVMGFLGRATTKFDGFIMLNLYAQRTPYPSELHKNLDFLLHEINLEHIIHILKSYKNPTILAAWGNTIMIRSYFIKCLKDIYKESRAFNVNWLKIGDLTNGGHPRHPSRAKYADLSEFDLEKYIQNF